MDKLTGGLANYYLVPVLYPQRKEQEPYQAECEDIAEALQLTPNEFCEFKAIWRTAAARLGNGKPDHKALYDAEKRLHYAQRDVDKYQRELAANVVPEPVEPIEELLPAGTVTENGWIVHAGNEMPEALNPDDLVEVKMEDSDVEYFGNFAKPAKDWKWFTDGRCAPISHYRLAKIQHEVPELDSWKPLTVTRIPDGLDPDEMVEVMVDDDVVLLMAKRANEWDWKYRSAGTPVSVPHITHWRRYRHGA